MKAKATLFALLIGMISLVGFGNTTDLSENSNAISIECYDAQPVMVCVDYPILEVATFPAENLMIFNFANRDISTVFKGHLNRIENANYLYQSFTMEPPNINAQPDRNLSAVTNKKPDQLSCNYYLFTRDGLVKPNNYLS